MNPNINSINTILRPSLKARIGTNDNVNGAIKFIQQQTNSTSYSAGSLSLSLFFESLLWSSCLTNVFIPPGDVSENTLQTIKRICDQADNSHHKGEKALVGAAIGANFGIFGAALGALFGWAVGQDAANKDLQWCVYYARQAADYYCDELYNRAILYINNTNTYITTTTNTNNTNYVNTSNNVNTTNNPNTNTNVSTPQTSTTSCNTNATSAPKNKETKSNLPTIGFGIKKFGEYIPATKNNDSEYVIKHIAFKDDTTFKLFDFKYEKEFMGTIDQASNNGKPEEYIVVGYYGYLVIKPCVVTLYIKLSHGNDSIYYEVEE